MGIGEVEGRMTEDRLGKAFEKEMSPSQKEAAKRFFNAFMEEDITLDEIKNATGLSRAQIQFMLGKAMIEWCDEHRDVCPYKEVLSRVEPTPLERYHYAKPQKDFSDDIKRLDSFVVEKKEIKELEDKYFQPIEYWWEKAQKEKIRIPEDVEEHLRKFRLYRWKQIESKRRMGKWRGIK